MFTGTLILLGGVLAIAAARYAFGRVTTPITSIASAPDATLVRIQGRVACTAPLRAPYSGRPCVFYKVELHSAQFNRRESYSHSDACDFTVTDATGTAQIRHDRAQYETRADAGEATRASRLSERGLEVVRELRWRLPDIAGVQLSESIICIDEQVDIAGIAIREAHPDEATERGFRDAPTQLVFSGEVYVRGRGG